MNDYLFYRLLNYQLNLLFRDKYIYKPFLKNEINLLKLFIERFEMLSQ